MYSAAFAGKTYVTRSALISTGDKIGHLDDATWLHYKPLIFLRNGDCWETNRGEGQ